MPPRPAGSAPLTKTAKKVGSPSAGNGNGQNASNSRARADRLDRSRLAVELQVGGATRQQIAERLGVSGDAVADLLRDGKFFANPSSDRIRIELAEKAADAQKRGLNRTGFRDGADLSNAKAKECWRDADVLFGGLESSEPKSNLLCLVTVVHVTPVFFSAAERTSTANTALR